MDLHSGQCVGYFDIPVDHVYGETVILDYLASKRIATGDLVVVSPDVGGVARARAFAKKLNDAPLAIIDKRRSAHNVSEVMHLIGDVKGKVAVLVDDMIDTAGTITNAGKALLQEGAKEVSRSDLKAAVCLLVMRAVVCLCLDFQLHVGACMFWQSEGACGS
jgi:ribose-phosphate pyrophosphokinase